MGKRVDTTFVGIRSLDVIHDPLQHGAELFYHEEVGLSAGEIAALARGKEQLEAFLDPEPGDGPDYSSIEVVDQVRKILRGGGGDPPN